jgi:hydroxymethylbilane synthase
LKHGSHRLILGSRGSTLARAQTEMVENALRAKWPTLAIEIQVIKTSGDEDAGELVLLPDKRSGRKGMFTAQIERALLTGEIDVAVHSAKDLPSDSVAGAEIGAVLKRAPVDDVLISKTNGGLESLPRAAIVATGSVRRANQLQSKRADLRIVDLRGNVPTRLRKLVESDWDAVLLARAGLERLGFEPARNSIVFEGTRLFPGLLTREGFIPAGGQGVIALQIRSKDESTRELVRRVNHPKTFLCLRAEREFLRLLQADCDSPVGVLAEVVNQEMTLYAQVLDKRISRTEKVRSSIRDQQPEEISAALFQRMYGQEK